MQGLCECLNKQQMITNDGFCIDCVEGASCDGYNITSCPFSYKISFDGMRCSACYNNTYCDGIFEVECSTLLISNVQSCENG